MKKIIIISSSLILLLSIGFIYFYSNSNMKEEPLVHESKEFIKEEIDEKKEDIKEDQDEIIKTNTNTNSENNKASNTSIPSSNKSNMESNNASNTNVIKKDNNASKPVQETKKETNTTSQTEEPKKEVEQPKEEVKKEEVRDDIVDTKSFFYSIHHGQIDTSNNDKCMSAGDEIAFIDTVDINYFRCYEVTSTTGKVLGYYLNIFCNSDNCNRYKNQINMSKYR